MLRARWSATTNRSSSNLCGCSIDALLLLWAQGCTGGWLAQLASGQFTLLLQLQAGALVSFIAQQWQLQRQRLLMLPQAQH